MKKHELKLIFLWLIIAAVCSTVSAQEKTYRLKDYVLSGVGDEWQYKNLTPDGLSPIVTKVSEQKDFGGRRVFKRDENNGDYRFQTLDENGLTVYQLFFVGERVIEYETPARLLPAQIKTGETYRSESKYKTFLKGELVERGTQTYAVTVERNLADADTPLGKFKNCLILRTVALRTDESGSQKGYELVEWHAKNVGAVRVTGELFWKNKAGETTRRFRINAELERATAKRKQVKAK